MVRLEGVEPSTSAFAGPRSIQMSYRRLGLLLEAAEFVCCYIFNSPARLVSLDATINIHGAEGEI